MVTASRYSVRVRVYDPVIAAEFTPGGQVFDEAKQISRRVRDRAILRSAAFTRTGKIAASHRSQPIPNKLYGARAFVENTARHALHKHEGDTVGRIIRARRNGSAMALAPGNGYPRLIRSTVRGYHPTSVEPWLRKAGNDILLPYGVQLTDKNVDLGRFV